MALARKRFRERSRKTPSAGFAFRKGSNTGGGKKSSVGFAFGKGSNHGSKWAGMGKFGDIGFLRRLLERAGTNLKNASGQTELLLMAQLGDIDALQLLKNAGFDAIDSLGDASLAALALTGDLDAERLLEIKKGIRLRKKVTAEDIDGFQTPMTAEFGVIQDFEIAPEAVYASPEQIEDAPVSPLKRALASAIQKVEKISRALQQEKPAVRDKLTTTVVRGR